ncbi:conjugative relaxase (plasmid) [Klebsiella pneumoniae]|nr:MobF family relaxase [Klebsiella pneumoniae]UNS83566.1 conjugative relaxase [Klebsiella pneumoniae]
MMSIGSVKSADKAADYYTNKDNYYVIGSMDERWQGKGAEALGIDGKAVDKALFTELLKGKLPDGSDLTRIQDGANKHRPGYDLTFSAPKSVSVMAMLGGDKRLIDAHNQAVTEAVRQLETLAATRVMTDGKSETVLTGNLIVAKRSSHPKTVNGDAIYCVAVKRCRRSRKTGFQHVQESGSSTAGNHVMASRRTTHHTIHRRFDS